MGGGNEAPSPGLPAGGVGGGEGRGRGGGGGGGTGEGFEGALQVGKGNPCGREGHGLGREPLPAASRAGDLLRAPAEKPTRGLGPGWPLLPRLGPPRWEGQVLASRAQLLCGAGATGGRLGHPGRGWERGGPKEEPS